MSISPSAGGTSRGHRAARQIGDVPFNAFSRAISSARVNLCITRRSHASVYASSSCRPFELASSGAAIVSNPYEGIERWFEPGSELIVVARRRRGGRRVSGAARRPRTGRGARPPCARTRPRRAHVSAPRAPGARPASGSSARREEGSRSSPRSTRRRAIGGVVDEIRAFDPEFDVVVIDDGSGDRTAEVAAEARRARAQAAVQPRHRRRRADRLPLRVGAAGTSSPCRSTATASTIRRSSRSCSRRSCRARPTSASARGSPARRATARRRAPHRDPHLRAHRLADHPPDGHRHDVGLPALNRRGDRAVRRATTRTTTPRSRRS